MQQNRISMVVTQQEEETVMAGLDQIETTLKGLITLGAEDRRKIRMMGPKRADFARAVIRTLQQNPQLAPSGLDVAGAQADPTRWTACSASTTACSAWPRSPRIRATHWAATSWPWPTRATNCPSPSGPHSG